MGKLTLTFHIARPVTTVRRVPQTFGGFLVRECS